MAGQVDFQAVGCLKYGLCKIKSKVRPLLN